MHQLTMTRSCGTDPSSTTPLRERARTCGLRTLTAIRCSAVSRRGVQHLGQNCVGNLYDFGSFPRSLQGSFHQPVAAVEPFRHPKTLGPQELRIEELRLITCSIVAEYRHDHAARTELPCQPNRASDIYARGGADAETLMLEQIEDHRDRFIVRYMEGEVRSEAFKV